MGKNNFITNIKQVNISLASVNYSHFPADHKGLFLQNLQKVLSRKACFTMPSGKEKKHLIALKAFP